MAKYGQELFAIYRNDKFESSHDIRYVLDDLKSRCEQANKELRDSI